MNQKSTLKEFMEIVFEEYDMEEFLEILETKKTLFTTRKVKNYFYKRLTEFNVSDLEVL